jgi:hypothetical protein
MYIRKSTRSYKGKIYSNYALVESVQTPKGPRQTTICSRSGMLRAFSFRCARTRRTHRKTLTEMLDGLGKRCGIPRGATVVIDRGMAYEENIAALKARNLNYVVASRQPCPTGTFSAQSCAEPRVDDEHTYVLCRSEQRVAKDSAIRTKHEARLRAGGASTSPLVIRLVGLVPVGTRAMVLCRRIFIQLLGRALRRPEQRADHHEQ